MVARTDVVVVGAGLAGLAAARHLQQAGLEVAVLEQGDAVGGRIRTDRRDGLLLDRGFQLLNPAYPEARRVLDLADLRLSGFAPGVAVRDGQRQFVLADPVRAPRTIGLTLRSSGSLRTKAAAAAWLAEVGLTPAARLRSRGDRSVAAELARRHLGDDGDPVSGAVWAFLRGVLADEELESSARMTQFLVRSFVRGTPGLPAGGMQAIPEQLAADLAEGTVRLNTPVSVVAAGAVDSAAGRLQASAIVVAAEAPAAHLLLGLPAPETRALTTFYHLVAAPIARADFLHVDARAEGPVVNVACVSAAASTYAPKGPTLVASSLLGVHAEAAEPQARAHAARLLGVPAQDWQPVGHYAIPHALPAHRPGQPLRRSVVVGDGIFVAGDHRDTPSIQGALVSGRRAGEAVLRHLGVGRAAS